MAGRGGDVSIEVGIEATKGMYLSKPLPYPSWSDQASGGMSIMDLPLQDLPRDQAMLKHFVDVIADVPPPDKTAIETAIMLVHGVETSFRYRFALRLTWNSN